MNKIGMNSWLKFHGRTKVTSTDGWYLSFANKLLGVLNTSDFLSDTVGNKQQLAVVLVTYFENSVGYNGCGWANFTEMHRQRYGTYLPFYELSESYLHDEVNPEDIYFLLWNACSGMDASGSMKVENPFHKELLKAGEGIYEFMSDYFEEAPIAEVAAYDWVIDPRQMEIDQSPLPEIQPGDVLKPDVERLLEASGGNPLMFFVDYSALKLFLVNVLKWPNEEDSLMPELSESCNIVLYANAKGLIVAPDVGCFFEDKRNMGYNPEMASTEGYSLFCDQGFCPFDLLKYAMACRLIPETAFPFENGKKLLHDNWDFIARWFLREYYEAD